MLYYEVEFDIHRFEFWGGAVRTVETVSELGMMNELEDFIIEVFSDSEDVTDTTINDFVWFEDDDIYDCLGIEF